MTTSATHRFVPAAAAVALSGLLLSSLSTFGIWDPWEIEISELARGRTSAAGQGPHLGAFLIGRSFALFGIHEWSGRLPIAISGLLLLALTYRCCAAFTERRSALYATVIAASSPLFVTHALTMLGEAPSILIQAAIAACAMQTLFAEGAQQRLRWMLAMFASVAVGIAARGALLCALPPLCAATSLVLVELRSLRTEGGSTRAGAIAIVALTLLLIAFVTHAVVADESAYSIWLGGSPISGQAPSFDSVIERIFHAFAPWSALVPLAFGRVLSAEPAATPAAKREQRLGLFCVLWAAFAYGALTLFLSRYGQRAALFPIPALAIAVALLLREVERSGARQWPAAIAAALLALLALRDYALYPVSALNGLPIAGLTAPEDFNPKLAWLAVFVPFTIAVTFGFGHDAAVTAAHRLSAPYRWLAAQWRRGWPFKIWLLTLGLALLGLELFALATFHPGVSARLTTLAVKVLRRATLLPVALVLAMAVIQLLLRAFAALGERRCWPVLACAALASGYMVFGYMPALSQRLSPRGVYDTYNRLAGPGEVLAEYNVRSRAAAYYAKGQPREIDSLSGLAEHLAAVERRWGVIPAEEFTEIDRAFRVRSKRHLFVVDDSNPHAMLVTNRPIDGRPDKNPLAHTVLYEAPAIATPLQVNFDDKVHLLGYKLDLPQRDSVGQGEHFEIVWYFRALKPIPGNYRVFVHIDGAGARIGGDHDPVDGAYPIRLWGPGDVIVDRQRIEVPATATRGEYVVYMGLYSGDTRLPIKAGPKDPVDRAITGALLIR